MKPRSRVAMLEESQLEPFLAGAIERGGELLKEVEELKEERDRYRLVLEMLIKRNKLMNPTICLDMLDKEAKKAVGIA